MPGTSTAQRRGTAALAVAAALGIGGAGGIAWVATHQVSAPRPATTAAPAPIDTSSPLAPADTTAPASGPAPLGRSVPVRIEIPAIGVRSPLLHLGLAPDGSLRVPQPGPRYDDAAWFTGSPTPGSPGPSVIEGHVDSADGGPSVFFELGALTPGDTVAVTRADGATAEFTVDAVRRYPKHRFPTATVYANTDRPALRLLTCGGTFDRATGHYRDNVVAFAHLTGVRR